MPSPPKNRQRVCKVSEKIIGLMRFIIQLVRSIQMRLTIRPAISTDKIPWPLLYDADPCRKEIAKYLHRGELWLAKSDTGVIGAMVVLQTRVGVLEIMNIAVDPQFQNRGVGKKLLKAAKRRAKQLKMLKLEVGTANNSFSQLAFYQKFGFRIVGVDPDFFKGRYSKAYRTDGVLLRDMIRMEMPV